MSNTSTVAELHKALQGDLWRRNNRFSDDIIVASSVLTNRWADEQEKIDAIAPWLSRMQTCRFGKWAAGAGALHYCFIGPEDLESSDEAIRDKIRNSLLDWKRRSLDPTSGSTPAHGFMLLVSSSDLLNSSPDANLKALVEKVRDLWGCAIFKDARGNDYAQETLYLRKSGEAEIYHRFDVLVDFFSAAADRRWWHDHRIPGGFAFTANSLGHWVRFREWYKDGQLKREILNGLRTSMQIIDEAHETNDGKATSLRELRDGKPHADVACPYASADRFPEKFTKQDWTRYNAYFDPDHSIRKEFFSEAEKKSEYASKNPWLADLTYIYRAEHEDHASLILGKPIPRDEVFENIGEKSSWRKLTIDHKPRHMGLRHDGEEPPPSRPRAADAEIKSALKIADSWKLTAEELQEILT